MKGTLHNRNGQVWYRRRLSKNMIFLALQLFLILSANSVPFITISVIFSLHLDLLPIAVISAFGLMIYLVLNLLVFLMIRNVDLVLLVINLLIALPLFLVILLFVVPSDVGFSTLLLISFVFSFISTSYWLMWILR